MSKFLCLFLLSNLAFASNIEVRLEFPKNVKRVKEAVEYLVEPIGYKLYLSEEIEGCYEIANSKLPKVNDASRPRELEDALLLITKNKVIIDRQNKLISFSRNINV